ncbi:Protein arginine N-methyltransferase 1.1 (AtPRMT11) (Arginine methyltransferase pam1) (Histone-arginine N-methyltransferase PRMT11) [Durusdinium trenchii]|uniref:Protein arginine N-methyltransferase 1.1 (AtPRMT11) (Arginine methyltransferase pam1) (Histone-arginine N-methyltransferase PRMT11) n=1 Tax=Durusdinium trenchii TaxID=1381693 RepID=A0ABP0Q6V4_9DINO
MDLAPVLQADFVEDADEAAPLPDESNENDESSSYNDLGVHREMLEDRVRTEAFREAIFQTCQDKVVLEVGCGSGILSVFAAQAGARRVVAVEADVEMAELAQEVVDGNGVDVNVLSGRVEEVAQVVDQALDGQKVDVLISEWMGFMLVCEDMFRSVVFARDRWLAEGGQMLPRRCQLFAAPFSHMELVERQTGFWGSKPYGVDLSVLAFPALDQHLCRPVIGSLTQQQLLSDGDLLFELDCQKAARDAVRQRDCHFTAVVQHQGHFHGIAVT